jgi:hypothetical protein
VWMESLLVLDEGAREFVILPGSPLLSGRFGNSVRFKIPVQIKMRAICSLEHLQFENSSSASSPGPSRKGVDRNQGKIRRGSLLNK